MKKMLLFVVMILAGVQLFADCSIKNNKVYFEDKIIKGADAKTFKEINYEYSKDKNNVYYYGEKIDDANPETFKEIDDSNLFYSDRRNVFFKGQKIKGADVKTFKLLNNGPYSKDKNYIFFKEALIDDADYESFEATDTICARDKNGVFYKGVRMEKDDTLNTCVKYYQNK
ncbi:DKNYY domain-containing protein [Leptotrichia trevisanii]|uniref:DKNYY domain-containing protein n=1 Tax=Leptotrichia trevisanii TaxID=109328 RepID=UPI0026EF3849|nr:DKNYY domain-containing protein [Leptotrichia trevisanii]